MAMAAVAMAELPAGGTFTDDDGNIHEGNIEAIAAEAITRGCNPPTNDLYCPGDPVTRGQMAAFLVRAMGYTDDNGGDHFTDDDGSVFESDIDRLATADVTRGCNPPTNDEYCPADHVTRGQMAAFLVRAMGYTDDGGGDHFTDDDGSVFEADIDRLATAGVTVGCNPPANDRFCPDALVLRDQMASFLARALRLAPITPPPPTSSTSSTTLPSSGQCTGTLGAVSIDDDLIVPSGASCSLIGTVVEGNVLVGVEATLQASGVDIDGNIQADGQAAVNVGDDSQIGGDVQVEQGASAAVMSSVIGGNIQYESNTGALAAVGNTVGGDIQAFQNTGGVTISDNEVDGNLQCLGNSPAPTGGGNVVEGNKEDQCAGL